MRLDRADAYPIRRAMSLSGNDNQCHDTNHQRDVTAVERAFP